MAANWVCGSVRAGSCGDFAVDVGGISGVPSICIRTGPANAGPYERCAGGEDHGSIVIAMAPNKSGSREECREPLSLSTETALRVRTASRLQAAATTNLCYDCQLHLDYSRCTLELVLRVPTASRLRAAATSNLPCDCRLHLDYEPLQVRTCAATAKLHSNYDPVLRLARLLDGYCAGLTSWVKPMLFTSRSMGVRGGNRAGVRNSESKL
jgi:hypothetical protein